MGSVQTFGWALDYLQGKMSVLEGSLNKMDFVGVWRSLATGVDKLVFNGILMSNANFTMVELRSLVMIWQFYLGFSEPGVLDLKVSIPNLVRV